MQRFTVCLTDEQEEKLVQMRKRDEFLRCSLSEIARKIFDRGIKTFADERQHDGKTA